MKITELSRQDSIELLKRATLARLACANAGQPYVTPIYYVLGATHVYSVATLGKKVAWMRANPLVCVQVDELKTAHDWATVIVSGKYEELSDAPEFASQREHAYELLKGRPAWWEPAVSETLLSAGKRPMVPVYFRISLGEISGHRGTPD
jgi:nitroimidazol reductase NimA-like FMN-containing flavoprotein (pyridoxamine 5'-phosphate oxidase superfamily)